MRKFVMLGLLAVLVAAFVAPQALAADDEAKFKFSGEVRTRLEYIENYTDFTNDTTFGEDDSFSFWPYRVRLAMEGTISDNVKIFGEFQNAGHFGADPNFSSFPTFLGFGSGSNSPLMYAYPVVTSLEDPAFTNNQFANEAVVGQGRQVNLYQGYLQLDKLFTDNLSLRVGRQEHTYGTELLLGDNDFYNGISFDGAHLMWHPEKFMLDGFYYKLNEQYRSSSDANLFGVTGNYGFGKKWGDVGAYVLVYQNLDDNDVVPVPSWLQWNNMALTTFGVRWGRMVQNADDMRDGAFDWNAEFAMQSGDSMYGTYKYDFKGSIFEGWFGWNFATGAGRSRVHLGTLWASGEPEDETITPNGQDWKGWIPLFGDTWAYNRLGDLDLFDMTDITDINLGYCFSSGGDKHQFMATAHYFELAEDVTFGTSTYKKLGTEIDLRYTMNMSKMTSFSAGVATLMPGDTFDKALDFATDGAVTSADSVNRVYAQLRVRF